MSTPKKFIDCTRNFPKFRKFIDLSRNFCRQHRLAVLMTVWIIFAAAWVWLSRAHAFSFNFHDETDHVAAGYFLYRDHLRLYQDLITIHQPLPVLVGGLFSLLVPHATLYAFISRLRLLMALFWAGAGAVLVWRFRARGLVASVITCLHAFAYFGFFVLAESLVWPAVAYLILAIAEQWWPPADMARVQRPRDSIIWGALCGWLIFNLLPLAPFIIVATIIYAWPRRQAWRREVLLVFGGFLLVAVPIFLLVSPVSWFRQTIVNFTQYWSADIQSSAPAALTHLGLWFTYPLVSGFISYRSPSLLIWAVLIIYPLIISYTHSRQQGRRVTLLYVLVVLLNNRVNTPAATLYEGFHLLPYLAGMAAFSAAVWCELWPRATRRIRADVIVLSLVASGIVGAWLIQGDDRQDKYEILFLPEQSLINVINILKKPGDRLLTGEEGYGYINLLTGIPFADRQNFHLYWSWRSPELRQDFLDTFAKRPPAFVYFPNHTGRGMPDLLHETILPSLYVSITNPGGTPSDLFYRADLAASLSAKVHADLAATYYALAVASSASQLAAD